MHIYTELEKAYIYGLKDGGLKGNKIATIMGRAESGVYKVLKKRYEEKQHKKVGRPPVLSERDERDVIKTAMNDRRQTLGEITNSCNSDVSEATIRRVLHRAGIKSRIAKLKPFLNKKHITQRRIFAGEHLNWSLKQWKNVIWTDEASFEKGKNSRKVRVWRTSTEAYELAGLAPTFKTDRESVMVWGAITYGKKSDLVFLGKDRRTATDFVDQVYEGALLRFLKELNEPLLMEDGAPVHRSKAPKTWRDEHKIDKLVWPAQSPDLNPIENIWMVMKCAVQKKHQASMSVETLKQHIQEAWNQIDIEMINHLIESMPRRVTQLSKNKGKSTRY